MSSPRARRPRPGGRYMVESQRLRHRSRAAMKGRRNGGRSLLPGTPREHRSFSGGVSPKGVVLRGAARRDIDEAIEFYVVRGAYATAHRLVDALSKAFDHLSRHLASGSPRYSEELDLPGLRHWPVRRHPYLVFYVAGEDHLDVWRVLHVERDIPEWLRPWD